MSASDIWSEWLLHHRHAGDAGYQAVVRDEVARYADRVLDEAGLFQGMRLLDVGTGNGLLALRAIERVGPTLHVVATDISVPLLNAAMEEASRRHVADQCTFLVCSAEKLAGIADASIDAVVTRASLAYVSDKKAAFQEFHRVLKPGGRLSIVEPIFQDDAFAARALRRRVESMAQPHDPLLPLLHRWKAAQFPDSEEAFTNNPLVNYSERDLFNFVRGTGFAELHLQLHIDLTASPITSWETFLAGSPHPWAPTLGSILSQQFSPEERKLFEDSVRPTVESGKGVVLNRNAYLNAVKPA
jgi:ubiquinone/menaquinone biosynthesis C-methylase UbiE